MKALPCQIQKEPDHYYAHCTEENTEAQDHKASNQPNWVINQKLLDSRVYTFIYHEIVQWVTKS